MPLQGTKNLLYYKQEVSEVNEMNDNELKSVLIDKYADLQRIKSAPDKEKELDYQIRVLNAKLESMGVVTTDLNIDE